MNGAWGKSELTEAERLVDLRLPPVTSVISLATMLGVNPGILWSIRSRQHRYYRSFDIPKGTGVRRINAPRVVLKVIQKWLSVQLQRAFVAPDHVYGFVAGRSHVAAATVHCGAHWVLSMDIADFFPSTKEEQVLQAYQALGYSESSSALLSDLSCFRGGLAQGAPTSPVLSNICMASVDKSLAELAFARRLRLTRYADDIVLSGIGEPSADLETKVRDILAQTSWKVSQDKVSLDVVPARLKVHGLLVHGDIARLTKGYRNRIRAYEHLMNRSGICQEDLSTIRGHIEFGRFVGQLGKATR